MPTFQFEAMDPSGQEIKDVVEAASLEEAQATIKQMGYFVTKISAKKARKSAAEKKKAAVNPVLCKGCGTCAAACQNKAISLVHFDDRLLLAEITGKEYEDDNVKVSYRVNRKNVGRVKNLLNPKRSRK